MLSVHVHVRQTSYTLPARSPLSCSPSPDCKGQNSPVSTWQAHPHIRMGQRALCPCIDATRRSNSAKALRFSLELKRPHKGLLVPCQLQLIGFLRDCETHIVDGEATTLAACTACVSSFDDDERGASEVTRPDFVLGQPLSQVSTWGIGGPAKYFIEVRDAGQMAHVLRYCHQQHIPTCLLGKGSNVLFDDRGFNGCVILNRVDFIERQAGGVFRVGAGVGLNNLAILTARLGYAGLEFATGIPGTVGGAVFMNAGAHGCETGDIVESVEIVSLTGAERTLSRNRGELAWAYRTSPFQDMGGRVAIVAATFKLERSEDARKRQMAYMDSRRRTQPVTAKSAGCVFRNPGRDLLSAGALVEQLGLKGFSVGGAQVSEKHANFLINTGSATCEDMRTLISKVKRRAREQMQIDLHEEIRYVAYTDEQ